MFIFSYLVIYPSPNITRRGDISLRVILRDKISCPLRHSQKNDIFIYEEEIIQRR